MTYCARGADMHPHVSVPDNSGDQPTSAAGSRVSGPLRCPLQIATPPAKYPAAISALSVDSSSKMPATDSKYAFEWSATAEPHATRRREILAKYGPAVRALYGPDPMIKWKVAGCLITQLICAWLCADAPWYALLVVAYTIGGVLNHSLSLALHETSHNLAYRSFAINRAFGYIANLAIGFPIFASFKRYHMEHHRYQGENGIDVDIPTEAGACYSRGSY